MDPAAANESKSIGLGFVRLDEAPLHPTGKTGSAAAAQARCFHFVDDVGARHRDRFAELCVAAVPNVAVEVDGVILAADVLENQAALEGMGSGMAEKSIAVRSGKSGLTSSTLGSLRGPSLRSG